MSNEENAAAPDVAADVDAAVERQRAYRASLAKRYYELCDTRDAVDAECEELKARRDVANAAAEAARVEADDLSRRINARRGSNWLSLKSEIATLAKALEKIPPRESLV